MGVQWVLPSPYVEEITFQSILFMEQEMMVAPTKRELGETKIGL